MRKKIAEKSGRSAYEIARDKAESGEDDEDDDGTVTYTPFCNFQTIEYQTPLGNED